jgi:hypothetical protein
LTNKQNFPTLFIVVDFNKFPKGEVWHCIYKLHHDKDCPFVALRIILMKSDFSKQYFKIQILEPVFAGPVHERFVALSKE